MLSAVALGGAGTRGCLELELASAFPLSCKQSPALNPDFSASFQTNVFGVPMPNGRRVPQRLNRVYSGTKILIVFNSG